jgi:hypothetical protein
VFIVPGNPSCSESDIRFRQRGDKLLTPFRYKIRVLPVGPGAVFRPHRIRWHLEPEKSVCIAGKFQHEEPLRSAEIKFDLTGAHACVLSRVGAPISRHRHLIARCIEFWLNVSQTFDGQTSGGFTSNSSSGVGALMF